MNHHNHSSNNIELFLIKFKWFFIIAFLVFIIIGISILLITQNNKTKSIEASTAFEALEEEYQNFIKDYNVYKDHETIDQEKMKSLLDAYTKITQKYPKEIIAQKSFLQIATIYVINKEYEKAEENFIFAAESPSSYLSPQALFNLASMQENTNKPTEAVLNYQKIVDTYPSSILAPHAMFNIARINEQEELSSMETIITYYQKIIEHEDWQDSQWKSIAESRLALLQKLSNDKEDKEDRTSKE